MLGVLKRLGKNGVYTKFFKDKSKYDKICFK